MPPIRVAIVEAQTLFAKALESILSENGPFSVALRTVAAGGSFVDARVDGGVLRGRSVGAKKTGHAELSARESEVLKLIADGLANKQISARLHLSEKTVKNHDSRIFSKSNITARTQAVVHAIRAGIV